MGWKGGLQGGAVVFCAAWGRYWGSLKMMILFWGGFVFRLPCGLGKVGRGEKGGAMARVLRGGTPRARRGMREIELMWDEWGLCYVRGFLS